MLFYVHMDVHLPLDMPIATAESLKATEREQARQLQQDGKWRHLWRVAGRYANISIFDVSGPAELHEIVSQLPLFSFMDITVVPVCRHSSSIHDDDR